jgi:AbiV family abortive infection protein
MRISDASLSELKVATFHNAQHLFRDACLLFRERSFPTAFALGVLSYEELGKLLQIDRVCDAICLNPHSRDWHLETLARNGFLTNHLRKQQYAVIDGSSSLHPDSPTGRAIRSGSLETLKQDAFYVDWANGDVRIPQRITRDKALGMLRLVRETIEEVAETAYNGVEGYSTQRSQRQAADDLDTAREIFRRSTGEQSQGKVVLNS